MKKRVTNMGRHKQVVCQKCCRVMRSDNLNRHMILHKKLCEDSLYSKSIYSSRASLDNESEFSSSETDWEAPVQKEIPPGKRRNNHNNKV